MILHAHQSLTNDNRQYVPVTSQNVGLAGGRGHGHGAPVAFGCAGTPAFQFLQALTVFSSINFLLAFHISDPVMPLSLLFVESLWIASILGGHK